MPARERSKTIYVPAGRRIVGRGQPLGDAAPGQSPTIRLADASTAFGSFILTGVWDVTITGLTFDVNGAGEFYAPIHIYSEPVRDIRITDNRFEDSQWTGTPGTEGDRWAISLGGSIALGEISERIWIERNTLTDDMQLTANGHGGVHDLWIIDNHMLQARTNGIAITGCVLENITIRGNVIREARTGISVGRDSGSSASVCSMKRITIEANHIELTEGSSRLGINVSAHRDADAATDDNQEIVILGNTITGGPSGGDVGIKLHKDADSLCGRWFRRVTVQGNTISAVTDGIHVECTAQGVISGNIVTGPNGTGGGIGIQVRQSEFVTVATNNIRHAGHGVKLTGIRQTTLVDNTVLDCNALTNDSYGIHIEAPSTTPIAEADVVVIGNRSGNSGDDPLTTATETNTQDFAVLQQASGGTFHVSYLFNDFRNNLEGDPVAGTEEFDVFLYNQGAYTPDAMLKRKLRRQQTIDFGAVASTIDIAVTFNGAEPGDVAYVSAPPAAMLDHIVYTAWVSDDDEVTVRVVNVKDTVTPDPPSGTFTILLERY